MENLNPPHTNGVMELDAPQQSVIIEKLVIIRDSLEEVNTFNIVAKYNQENEFKINGDTCENLLSEVGE